MKVKLSEYAKQHNTHYVTAYRWFKSNKIPHTCTQIPSGAIYVNVIEESSINQVTAGKEVYIYARVSSHDQKEDLQRQITRLSEFSISNGYIIKGVTKEIASGMNQNRKGLLKLLNDATITTILVEHRDRLSRFGFNLIQESLKSCNRNVLVVNETDQDMANDLLKIKQIK